MKSKGAGLDKNRIILLLGVALQLAVFFIVLRYGGVHSDEAGTILNARSIADHGTDINSRRLPIYFNTSLYGGQSPVATYLMALFIRLFGYSLLVSRLPMLIMSIISIFAFNALARELFPDREDIVNCSLLMCILSPWHLMHGAFTLDCNYFAHFFVIGCLLLARAVHSGRLIYYLSSMAVFGIGFHCYMASAYITPVFLTVVFLVLLAEKRVGIGTTALCVAALALCSSWFIAFGLVNLGVIRPFSLWGISFYEMKYYARATSFEQYGSVLNGILNELGFGLKLLAYPDSQLDMPVHSCFVYTNTAGGALTVAGLICIFLRFFRKKDDCSDTLRAFYTAVLVGGLIFCVLAQAKRPNGTYRFGAYNYFMYIAAGVALALLLEKIKGVPLRRALPALLAVLMLSTLGIQFRTNYMELQVKQSSVYTDSFCHALELAEKKSPEDITICNLFSDNGYMTDHGNMREAAYLRYYYYGKRELAPFDKDFLIRGGIGRDNNISEYTDCIDDYVLCEDNTLRYKTLEGADEPLSESCVIAYTDDVEKIKFDHDAYSVERFGPWSVIYKS